jgi:hypothetical protein
MIETRQQYFEVLTDAIHQTENYISRYPELSIYTNILTQLLFIQNIVMNEKRVPQKDEVNRVSLGSIAVKNFDYENDPYADLLMDCYSKFLRFKDLK